MNMISQLRARIQEAGMTILTADEYNQLQREWITRTGAEDMVEAERERCAKLCEWLPIGTGLQGRIFAEAIRGDGQGGRMAQGFGGHHAE
jgi:hypothetical protein